MRFVPALAAVLTLSACDVDTPSANRFKHVATKTYLDGYGIVVLGSRTGRVYESFFGAKDSGKADTIHCTPAPKP